MKTSRSAAATAALRVDHERWHAGLDGLLESFSSRFARVEARRNAGALVLGLLADIGSKNCWTIAELSGHGTPDRLQHLLSRAKWDADLVRDDVRSYVIDHLADPDAVLVVDETGDLKKGTNTVGVQRQYTGTAGRTENCQVAVYLTYAAARGHTLIDRALYLPQHTWATDPQRRTKAGVPDTVEFATKPALATTLVEAALDADVPASWVAGDEVYGADPNLRKALHNRQIGYVLAVGCNRQVPTAAGKIRVDALAENLPPRSWHKMSAGAGSKGHRWYSWALIATTERPDVGLCHVLVRRNDSSGELAFYRCYSPAPVPLNQYVRVAGRRWTVEESFQSGKGLTGLDQHQVRTWTSWHRWITLVMAAHAFLAVHTATERLAQPSEPGLIRLSVNEFRKLFTILVLTPLHAIADPLRWSLWRRKHQYRARQHHYQRRSQQQ